MYLEREQLVGFVWLWWDAQSRNHRTYLSTSFRIGAVVADRL